MIALIYGSRTWDDKDAIHQVIDDLLVLSEGELTVMHGDCPSGADRIAKDYCKANNIPMDENPADWDRYKKRAGRIRNTAMRDKLLESDEAFICIGFRNDGESYGTDMMTGLLVEENIMPTVFHPGGEIIHE